LPNAKVLKEKQQVVEVVTEKLKTSASTIVADYRGLNVADITELRKQLREAGIEYSVIKNTLLRRASEGAELAGLEEYLTGPTAVAFSKEDPVAAAKILVDFAKKNENLEVKGGVVDGQVFNQAQIKELASLPSKDGMLSMLLSVLQAPVRNFALAVKAVAEKQEA
jgi:large subunit ribosomal protein L10